MLRIINKVDGKEVAYLITNKSMDLDEAIDAVGGKRIETEGADIPDIDIDGDMNYYEDLALTYDEDLRSCRKDHGLTQQELSDKFGIPKRSIENWEGGVNKCPDYVENMIIEKLEFDKGIVLDALADLMDRTYESFKDRRGADDAHSMIYWEGRARRIYDQYVRVAGKASVTNVLGMDVQKNEVKSAMDLIEESMDRMY